MAKGKNQLTGDTGEFLVAAELARRGWTTSITLGNAARTDLLAQDNESGRLIGVQVKTRTSGSFQLGRNAEELPTSGRLADVADEWFVLVSLGPEENRQSDTFHIIPRVHLSAFTYVGHRCWLKRDGRGGKPHKDSSMRAVKESEVTNYLERWDLLQSPAAKAEWMLPDWWWDNTEEFISPVWPDFELPPREHSLQG